MDRGPPDPWKSDVGSRGPTVAPPPDPEIMEMGPIDLSSGEKTSPDEPIVRIEKTEEMSVDSLLCADDTQGESTLSCPPAPVDVAPVVGARAPGIVRRAEVGLERIDDLLKNSKDLKPSRDIGETPVAGPSGISKRKLLRSSSTSKKSAEGFSSEEPRRRSPSKITISDDSDVEDVILTSTGTHDTRSSTFLRGPALEKPRTRKGGPGRPKKKVRRVVGSPDILMDDVPDTRLEDLPSLDIGKIALEWLSDIDSLRQKSGKLQGVVSGHMRTRTMKVQEAVRILTIRADARGDPSYLQNKNDTLVNDLWSSKKRVTDLKRELAYAESKIKDLQGEMRYLREFNDPGRSDRNIDSRPKAVQTSPHLMTLEPAAVANVPEGSVTVPRRMDAGSVKGYMEALRGVDERMCGLMRFLETIRKDALGSCESSTGRSIGDVRPDGGTPFRGGPGPRIVENIQLVPPREGNQRPLIDERTEDEAGSLYSWTRVRRPKMERRRHPRDPNEFSEPGGSASVGSAFVEPPRTYAERLRRGRPSRPSGLDAPRPDPSRIKPPNQRKPPRSAAVAIRPLKGEQAYAEVMRKARDHVSLAELGINDTRVRKSANGSLLIEISGPNNAAKADLLAERLKVVMKEEALISRPMIRGELRLVGLDHSISLQEIRDIVREKGGCPDPEIKLGPIRPMRNGLGMIWVQCPLASANRVCALGRVRIGWSSVRVESLGVRPRQCYKCWEFGHVRGMCKSQADWSNHCFRCGALGHGASTCTNPPNCVICSGKGAESSHRVGSLGCTAGGLPQRSRGLPSINRIVETRN